MEIQKSQKKKNLEKNKKNQILGCFLKIQKIAKKPGFDSFVIFFWLFCFFSLLDLIIFWLFVDFFWFFNLSLF